jgi:predicted Zn-dependent protease
MIRFRFLCCAAALAGFAALGCGQDGFDYGTGGQGPGHRNQQVALSAQQEVQLGDEAFQEVMAKEHPVTGAAGQRLTQHVQDIGEQIFKQALDNKLLREEIGLSDADPYGTPWNFNARKYVVLESDQVNAFCLPGGKVAVFTGLLGLTKDNDAWLATVLGHEIAHAVAHHSSERIAREQMYGDASNATAGSESLKGDWKLLDLLGMGQHVEQYAREQPPESRQPGLFDQLRDLQFDRQQEEEADHIGVFFMAFAGPGYDPEKAVEFWQAMEENSGGKGVPEILSDHPSDQHRIALMRQWAARAQAAHDAWKQGNVVH